MLTDNVIKNLVKNYFYEVAFNILYTNSRIIYRTSYRTSGNRIKNIGGNFANFNWDCEFVNGIIHKINILDD